MKLTYVLFAAIAGSAIGGCYMSSGLVDNGGNGNGSDAGAVVDTGSSGDPTGVPCDVETVLANNCQSCHGTTPSGGAPTSMVSYQDLTQPSKMDPNKSEIQLAVDRMNAGTMPPGGGAAANDIATLQAWIDAGTPQGTACSGNPGNDPLNTPAQCSSNQKTSYCSNEGCAGLQMNPGIPCGNCHGSWVAGTVYPTGHEPDLCLGKLSDSITVQVTDANGKVATTTADPSTGNFRISSRSLTAPFKAQVSSSKGTRKMNQTAPNGNCNSCHTQNGLNGAPGRITVPF